MTRASKPLLLLAATSLLVLGACTDPAMQGGMDPNKNTKQGAVMGGLLGAVSGIIVSDNNKKGAIIGGIVGAGIGAGLGQQLDRQEAELRNSLDNRVAITNTGDRLIVTLPQDILFDVDSSYVSPGLRDDLAFVAESLNRFPDSSVQVQGHTDNTGSAQYNLDLSQRRASAVSSILISSGVNPRRVRSIGRGEDQPVASNLTPQGRSQNRRVDIVILPN